MIIAVGIAVVISAGLAADITVGIAVDISVGLAADITVACPCGWTELLQTPHFTVVGCHHVGRAILHRLGVAVVGLDRRI